MDKIQFSFSDEPRLVIAPKFVKQTKNDCRYENDQWRYCCGYELFSEGLTCEDIARYQIAIRAFVATGKPPRFISDYLQEQKLDPAYVQYKSYSRSAMNDIIINEQMMSLAKRKPKIESYRADGIGMHPSLHLPVWCAWGYDGRVAKPGHFFQAWLQVADGEDHYFINDGLEEGINEQKMQSYIAKWQAHPETEVHEEDSDLPF